jgi:hypothetical protein
LGRTFDGPATRDQVVEAQVLGQAGNQGDGLGIDVDGDRDDAGAGIIGGDVYIYVDAATREEEKCGPEKGDETACGHRLTLVRDTRF